VRILQRFCGFQLDQDAFLDQQVGYIFSHDGSIVKDLNLALLLGKQAFLADLVGQSVLVNLFKKPAA
jgi:hypothetical protein